MSGWQSNPSLPSRPLAARCDTCKDAGFVAMLDAEGKAHTRPCPDCTDWTKRSRLTPEEQKHRMDDIVDRKDDPRREMWALRFMGKQMLADPYGYLTIYGHKGGGKSLLLTALIAEFCLQGKEALYFNASEIVTALNPGEDNMVDGFRYVAGNPESAKRRLKTVPVLAIDEPDKIKWSSWQVQHIGEVLEHRHRNAGKLVTLFAMNKPPWLWPNANEVEFIASRMQDGRFYRLWPAEHSGNVPACAVLDVDGRPEIPGIFEVTLPDMRPALRRY